MYLRTSQPGTDMNSYYYNKMDGREDAFAPNINAAIERMLTQEKVLFFGSAFAFAHDHRFVPLVMKDSIHGHHVWAFQKSSELTEFFNYHLYKLKENGIMSKLYDDRMRRANEEFNTISDAIPIGYENALLPYFLLACGIVASIATLAFEHLKSKIKKNVIYIS